MKAGRMRRKWAERQRVGWLRWRRFWRLGPYAREPWRYWLDYNPEPMSVEALSTALRGLYRRLEFKVPGDYR